MIGRLIVAIAYGVLVGIVLFILGAVLASVHVDPLTALGKALEEFAWAIGLLVAILSFFGGWSFPSMRV